MTHEGRVQFTREMKDTHTILIPNMLPMHFKLIANIFRSCGYKVDILETGGPVITETGLKYVHNDTCYPAILVIGQFINALESGKYDPNKTALLLVQTGGGCRASNYIPLLRKALKKAGMPRVPVISFNILGLEENPGFKVTLPIIHRMLYGLLFGDLLMCLKNQTRPYEREEGAATALANDWTDRIAREMRHKGLLSYKRVKQLYKEIVADFAALPREGEGKPRVGIVGEIYVKFSPLGNNNLEDFLVAEGAEPVLPGLLDFCLYCVYNSLVDNKLYGTKKLIKPFVKIAYKFFIKKQNDMIAAITEGSDLIPPTSFDITRTLVEGYINHGAKMGEGWLLPAEMLELIHSGTPNVICTQPFGCLPNHIMGKGMMRKIKEGNPEANIVAIDYDAGATKINQENRIKLMLENARGENKF